MLEEAYRQAGARYLAGSGTDVWGTMPGISLHQELDALSRIGLSPREVLAAATSNFAKVFPTWGAVGEVREGQRAHLVVLSADPRVDVANLKSIEKVILAGEVLDPSALLQAGAKLKAPGTE
jgi:imidazolonepropionase-like amidohydrolase